MSRKVDEVLALPPAAPDKKEPVTRLLEIRSSVTSEYVEAETLVEREIVEEYGAEKVQRNVVLFSAKTDREFDIVVTLRRALVAVEMRLFARPRFDSALFDKLAVAADHIDRAAQQGFGLFGGSLVLFAVTKFSGPEMDQFAAKLRAAIADHGLAVEVRAADLESLREKYRSTTSALSSQG